MKFILMKSNENLTTFTALNIVHGPELFTSEQEKTVSHSLKYLQL